jgi:hypothetical protein
VPSQVKLSAFEERFWSGVEKSESCWEWQRYCCTSTGYGRMSGMDGYTKIGTHRASWMIHNGSIPDGMHVLHACDNRKCVRPDHLFLGTHQDNMRDMWEKGRGINPPRPQPGRSLPEKREANKVRMGKRKTHCKRGHLLPPYEPGRARKCMEPDCRNARRYNALGGK